MMHELGMLAGESDYMRVPCTHPDAREYEILVKLLSATQQPALLEVRAEAWPSVPTECRRLADYDAEAIRKHAIQDLNRVSFAIRANAAYRRRLHERRSAPAP